jgi:hypothetical protein
VGERLVPVLMTAVLAAAFASRTTAGEVCQGPAPSAHAVVHGPVLAVPDGASLCVATGISPSTWVRIPLDHLQATHAALMAAAFGKNATCTVDADGRGACVVEGKPLTELLHSPEIVRATYNWR